MIAITEIYKLRFLNILITLIKCLMRFVHVNLFNPFAIIYYILYFILYIIFTFMMNKAYKNSRKFEIDTK